MKSLSILFFVAGFLSSSPIARAQAVVFSEDFESGAPGWTFTGLAHIEPQTSACGAQVAPFPSPGHCLWFGLSSTCNYDVPGALPIGAAILPSPISFPAVAPHLTLRFRRYKATEDCTWDGVDVTYIVINAPGGNPQYIFTLDCFLEPGWTARRIDLSPFAGLNAEIQIVFSAGDDYANDTLGYWIDDFEIVDEPGAVTCTATSACPCANQSHHVPSVTLNDGDSGGCMHSGAVETRLYGNGAPSVANDSVELVVHDLPPSTALVYVQGTTQQSTTFGDGRRCIGGTATRLAVRSVAGGEDTYPHAGELGIALAGSVPPVGATRTYQVVYRDAASYCTASTFNTSNGYSIAWRP